MVLSKTEDLCSVAFTGDHKQEVLVKARTSVLIPYTVIPLRAGELPLQVTAVSRSFTGQDAIRKNLRVVVRLDVELLLLKLACNGNEYSMLVVVCSVMCWLGSRWRAFRRCM